MIIVTNTVHVPTIKLDEIPRLLLVLNKVITLALNTLWQA